MDLEIDSVLSKEYDPNNVPVKGRFRSNTTTYANSTATHFMTNPASTQLNSGANTKGLRKEETNILSKMVTGRNQLFLEPFDVFDPHHPLRGKKRFDSSFRPLRSKINIKINAPEATRKKRINKVTVE